MRTDEELYNMFTAVDGVIGALRNIYYRGRADAEKEAADALAAEKAAHEKVRECLQRERVDPGVDNNPPECARCGDEFTVDNGDDVTPYCDDCAHVLAEQVEEMRLALAAEKAAHERKRGELVAAKNELASCEERIRHAVLAARRHASQPWVWDVLAALGQPVAEREGEAQKAPEPVRMCRCGLVLAPDSMCSHCGWSRPGQTLTPDDVRKLALDALAQVLRRGTP